MAFEKLEVIVRSGASGMPASVRLSGAKSGRPLCIIGISGIFAKTSGIKGGEKFDVLRGTSDQKGLIRLKRSKTGLVTAHPLKGGSCRFSLGHIEKFGSEAEPKCGCNAEMIDADTIEIVLPRWADEIDD